MVGQTDAGGERRRALREERASAGRRGAAHAAPAAPDGGRDPFTTPARGTEAVWPDAPAPLTQPLPAPASQLAAPTPPLGTPLPSRRDRAALRRPIALDEPAVQAAEPAWRTSPALEDPRTASAIARPSPLTHALARTLTEHLDSLTPPTGLSTGASSAAPSVYVPRRRSAPAVSGPLPVVGTTTAEPRREPSWTTEPVSSRRSQRPGSAPGASGALGAPGALGGLPPGEAELPPPPPAAEVEAAVRARAARLSTAPVPPPMPDRLAPDPSRRSSVVVPTSGFPAAAPAAPTAPTASPLTTATPMASPLTTATPTTSAATTATPTSTPQRTEARHGRSRPTGRAAGRLGSRPSAGARLSDGVRPSTGSSRSTAGTAADASAAAGRGRAAGARHWHQRRALGVPVGLLTAAVAMAAAVVVAAWSSGATPSDVATVLASASGSAADGATPAAATPTGEPAGGGGEKATADQGGAAADAPQGGAGADAAASSAAAPQEGAGQPAASAAASSAAPASPAPGAALIPTGDVTYEGFGTAKDTYVELGTKDSRDVHEDLGATFSTPMAGSKDWPGWYVAVYSYDGAGKGSVGCRIKDADGRVLAEETSADGQLAMCTLGKPAGAG